MKHMNEEELKALVAKNLATYRKLNNLTQLELAERLNYSDKAISKWESGASIPDLFTLTQIANIYGIGINELVKERNLLRGFIVNRRHDLVATFSIGIVYFIACIFFAVFLFLVPISRPWLSFLYGVPVSSITLFVLYSIWKRKFSQFILLTTFIWSVVACIDLSIPHSNNWIYYILAIPLQIIVISVFLFKKSKKNEV